MELAGGPWHGQRADMPDRGTLTFRLYGFHGYYDGCGVWSEVMHG